MANPYAAAVWTILRSPFDVADLTAGWFAAVLDADVTSCAVLDRHSGTTGRARVALSYGSGVEGRPATVFVKLAPFDDRQRRFVDAVGLGIAEARFYRELGVRVPTDLLTDGPSRGVLHRVAATATDRETAGQRHSVAVTGTSRHPLERAHNRRSRAPSYHLLVTPHGYGLSVSSGTRNGTLTRLNDPRFTKPLYTVTEAASYLGVPRATLDTWVRGYIRRPAGRRVVRGEALLTSIPGGRLTIPFVGLAEGMVLAAFRETGLPLQRIRPALQLLQEEVGLQHALASRNLYTDGAEVLYDYARSHGDKQLRLLTIVRSGQRVFHEVIDRYLKRIEYDGGWAVRLALPITDEPLLVADPARAFGQPIFIHGAARLADVRGRIEAGEDERLVAEDYGVPLEDVQAALAAPVRAAA